MKDMINNALSHPIGTAILIGTITGSITSIIRAVKGNAETPMLNVNFSKHQTE
jgi:hypothetical protein